MAEIIGFLKEDATYGEQQTLIRLKQNLPKEFSVYVETPIHKKREIRFPDFIIITNYGVVVFEVKDWIMVEKADPRGATIRMRNNQTRWEKNPVETAREYAIALNQELKTRSTHDEFCEAIPWSYAAVLYNLPSSVITQLRQPWGEEFVIGKSDLDNPDILLNRIKMTFPARRMRPLSKEELTQIRATIYPVVEIEMEGRPAVILDEQQEKIVAEPLRTEPEPPSKSDRKAEQTRQQQAMFEELKKEEKEEDKEKEVLPAEGERLSQNVSIRLVRGFSGSGKTLVLIQRAKFLAAQYPDWKIGVLTYNKQLQEQLKKSFKGSLIVPQTFHSLCLNWVSVPNETDTNLNEWLKEHQAEFAGLKELGRDLAKREIDWLRDMGIVNREDYLKIERKGIGKERRLLSAERNTLFDIYETYRSYLNDNHHWDWEEVPLMTLRALENKPAAEDNLFDAILIDEAQDWAPVWFKIINRLIHPEHGLIFLADDPSQSIYCSYSWKEKAVHVVGRTRWLKVPYRNTYEIYRAAYSMIANYAEIQKLLSEEGEVVEPELSSQAMRHGTRALFQKCRNDADELQYIKNTIAGLRQEGYPESQIVVLVRYRRDLEAIQTALRGSGVEVKNIHGYKGLEVEAVILPHLESTFSFAEDEAQERRLLYMAMSRARSRLYLTYSGKLPAAYEEIRRQGLADFIE